MCVFSSEFHVIYDVIVIITIEKNGWNFLDKHYATMDFCLVGLMKSQTFDYIWSVLTFSFRRLLTFHMNRPTQNSVTLFDLFIITIRYCYDSNWGDNAFIRYIFDYGFAVRRFAISTGAEFVNHVIDIHCELFEKEKKRSTIRKWCFLV